jgi:methionyl-tRNA formyltransferase
VWALALNDAQHVGFTIHRVAEKVDAGDIVHLEHVPLEPGESFVGYLARFQRRASEAFVSVLDRVLGGSPVDSRRQSVRGRFFPPAGLRAVRRARKNFDRLTHGAVDPSAERVAAQSPALGA